MKRAETTNNLGKITKDKNNVKKKEQSIDY